MNTIKICQEGEKRVKFKIVCLFFSYFTIQTDFLDNEAPITIKKANFTLKLLNFI